MKTITLITLFVGALAFITNAYASVSANLGVNTEYFWRGMSQSNGEATVNGGFDYEGEGFYAGIWTSSTGAGDMGAETDFYVGTDINGFDVGYIKYEYTGDGPDFAEWYVGYSIQGFDLFYAITDGNDEETSFYSVSYGLPSIIEGVDSSLTYGDTEDGVDYLQLDVTVSDVTLSVIDTDAGTETALSYGWSL